MGSLPEASSVLAVCAHPDDESFGLGAALAAFAARGTPTAVLCLTHGAASALGTSHGDLHQIRAAELAAAAAELGVGDVELLDYPDGALAQEPAELLGGHVQQAAAQANAGLLLVFDEGGITGHPDHRQATRAASLFARRARLPVLAWAVEQRVAATLNSEFGTSFMGRTADQIDCSIEVDRQRQLSAISDHLPCQPGPRQPGALAAAGAARESGGIPLAGSGPRDRRPRLDLARQAPGTRCAERGGASCAQVRARP
jgi:LmbE family N-acetylglucosaminyl deacetylase